MRAAHTFPTDDHDPSGLALWRRWAEDQIDRLIEALDTLDGDPDLEGGQTIESLGHGFFSATDPDLEQDTADDEPELGAPETVRCDTARSLWPAWGRTRERCDQTRWAQGKDADNDDVDREDGADDEPSLASINLTLDGDGAANGICQTSWSAGGTEDLETGDDTGIADADGLDEQAGLRLSREERAGIEEAKHEAQRQVRRLQGPPRDGELRLIAWMTPDLIRRALAER